MNSLVVLSVVLAVAAASPSGLGLAGLGWGGVGYLGGVAPWGGVATPWAAGLAAPWGGLGLAAPHAAAGAIGPVTSVAAAPLGLAPNYRGPVSLAPGQPANILAQDGRPLDTLSVNLDRAAHLTARAVNNGHLLKKRSVGLLAPAVAWSHTSRIDIPAARLAVPVAAPLVAPLGHGAAIAPWGLAAGHGAALAPWGLGAGHWAGRVW